jgi:uncharacterized protein DUF2851
MSSPAAALRANNRRIGESPRSYEAGKRRGAGRDLLPLGERDLARIWESGRLPAAALVTLDGTPLQIVYRGRPNAGAGPDFRDAVIALPDATLLHGDVELHLLASDFRRHGHDRDPAYRRVILHLVFRADAGARTLLPGGRDTPIIELERWLRARAAEIKGMLEQPALWREPCQTAVERLGAEDCCAALERLGERRLRSKAAAISARPPVQAFYEALLRTLGQGSGRKAWVDLAHRLPISALSVAGGRLSPDEAISSLEALFLGAGGLLPQAEIAALSGVECGYLLEAWQRWRSSGAPAPRPLPAGGSQRPANHAARRLAGLARLLAFGPEALLGRARLALLSAAPSEELLALLTVAADGVWAERLLPWGAALQRAPALIGRGKALELAVNAVLPVLLAEGEREGRPLLSGSVMRCFHALPAPQRYGRIAHLERALRLEDVSLIRGADRSQGGLHLWAKYCTRGGCGRCPLS